MYTPRALAFVPRQWHDAIATTPRLWHQEIYSQEQIKQAASSLRMMVAIAYLHRDALVLEAAVSAWQAVHRRHHKLPLCHELCKRLSKLAADLEAVLLDQGQLETAASLFGDDLTQKYGTAKLEPWNIAKIVKDASVDIDQRRRLINMAVLLKKVGTNRILPHQYLLWVEAAEDDNWSLPYTYHHSLRIIAMPPPALTRFLEYADLLTSYFGPHRDTQCGAFITLCMQALAPIQSHAVLNYWQYKLRRLPDHVTPEDLRLAMEALADLKLDEKVLQLYDHHPELHDDCQIDVLLQITADNRDWLRLQAQFEDMYGRKNLPHVVHYTMVMRALALMGAVAEVEQLYQQLGERQLKPTPEIFAARISAALNDGDWSRALAVFDEYVACDHSSPYAQAYLYHKLMAYQFKMAEPEKGWRFFQDALTRQQLDENIRLVNTHTLKLAIRYFATNFRADYIEVIAQLVNSHPEFAVETVRLAMVDAYIQLGQFQLAKQWVDDAHMLLSPPWSRPPVYAAQVKVMRMDPTEYTHRQLRQITAAFTRIKIKEPVTINLRALSPVKRLKLYMELIKWLISRREIDNALSVLKLAQRHEVVSESHYIPFLKHFSMSNDYAQQQRVIHMYREMNAARITMTTTAYVPLMRAVAYLDHREGNFANLFKLFALIFEMKGIKVEGTLYTKINPTKPLILLTLDMLHLCQLILIYVTALGKVNSLKLLVNFLDLIKREPHAQPLHDIRIKMAVYKEMMKVLEPGDGKEKVNANAWRDLDKQISRYADTYPFPGTIIVPKVLSDYARWLVGITKDTVTVETVYRLYQQGVHLGGVLYNILFTRFLNGLTLPAQLDYILEMVELDMAPASQTQHRLRKMYHYLYHKAVVVLAARGADFSKFGPLNDYYGVDAELLPRGPRANAKVALRQFVEAFNQVKAHVSPTRDDPEWVLRNPGRYFNPEKIVPTPHRLSDLLNQALWHALHTHMPTTTHWFAAMDRYPETIDHMLQWHDLRSRVKRYRAATDDIRPPAGPELYRQRLLRNKQVLRFVKGKKS